MFLGQISRPKSLHKTGTFLWDFQKTSLLQTKLGHQKLGHGGRGVTINEVFDRRRNALDYNGS